MKIRAFCEIRGVLCCHFLKCSVNKMADWFVLLHGIMHYSQISLLQRGVNPQYWKEFCMFHRRRERPRQHTTIMQYPDNRCRKLEVFTNFRGAQNSKFWIASRQVLFTGSACVYDVVPCTVLLFVLVWLCILYVHTYVCASYSWCMGMKVGCNRDINAAPCR